MFLNINTKKRFFLFAVLLILSVELCAQSLKIPMIKSDKKVNSLAWSLDSSLFAYTDGTDIVIRDSDQFFVRHTITTPYKNILQIKFVDPIFDDSEEDRQYILLVTDTNIIEIRQLYFFSDDIGNKLCADNLIFQLQGTEDIKACSFTSTPDIRFIALGYEDGSFTLYNYNTISEEYIEEGYEIGETPLTSIDISTNQDMLLTCTDNGIIYIWNNKMEALAAFAYDDEFMQQVCFNNDEDYPLLFAVSENSLAKYNINARQKKDSLITTDNPIKDFSVSVDRKTALVLDDTDTLNVFNLDNSDYIGFIPHFSLSPITQYQIDLTQSKFLISHEDNTIFILEISKVLFPKNAKLPNADLIHMDEDDALKKLYEEEPEEDTESGSGTGTGTGTETGTIAGDEETVPVTGETEDGKHLYEALAMIRYKNSDTISFRLKGSVTPGPYIWGASFAAGYIAYRFIQPFYFGGFMEPHVGFPQKDFPYTYAMDGATIANPLIIGGKFYFPFGLCVYPFQKNIEFFVDFAPGIVFNMLWNTKFDNAITSNLYTGFYGALRTGITYKNFSVFIEGNYDAILGFGVSIGIGYNINIIFNKTIEDEDPSLEE
ncbi:MAG: hypothetical protein J5710_11795 [Treponema sp.]|nr:hypothetical protein [Treponema sp.]